MKFESAAECEQVCYEMRLADFIRGKNRERIDRLLDGYPPFDEEMAESNGVKINVNFLEGTVLAHDARAQFYGAFLKPGIFFTSTTDMGPTHKRSEYSNVVTQQMNKVMKRSMVYFETFRSKFALNVAHGIGPATWANRDCWCPDAARIADIGIPARTQLTMKNLPFFYVYRSFTAPELIKLTGGSKVDEGWNKDLVEQCIRWVDAESLALMGSNWPEVWSPEKMEQRVKGDGGFYAGDQVPTIDCFDFYFWNDDKDEQGWNRRIILDSWSTPQAVDGKVTLAPRKGREFGRNQFLYNSKNRKVASKVSELISFQFADLSAVAPFEYHSVRSLGWLVYAVCNLQNRMRCKFSESVFEALMNYYRVNSLEDVDRAMHLDLINHGFIDPSIQFVPREQRWNVDAQLAELGMKMNSDLIERNSTAFVQQSAGGTGDRKTRFQVMAEMQQTTALVNAAFNQAYQYQEAEYREIFRRFCKKNSTDPEVIEFQTSCMKRGVPRSLLDPCCWDIEPTRIMGGGNQTLQMQISQQLMEMRQYYDPDAQRELQRDVTFMVTGDADKAQRWCPDKPVQITDSVHDAQVSMGTLMAGFPVAPKTGMNHKEYIGVYLVELGQTVQGIEKSGGMATPDQIKGFQMVAQAITQHLQILAQDKNEKQFVAEIQKQLSKIMNLVRAFVQRLQQAAPKQQQNGGGIPPETRAKLQATQLTAQAKAQNMRESHAQKTAQRQISFEAEEQRKARDFENEQQRENVRTATESLRSLGDDTD